MAHAESAYLCNVDLGSTVQTVCVDYAPYRLCQLLPEDIECAA